MNGAPLNETHGAPLRLRNERELGFKQVKWIEAIEFVVVAPLPLDAVAHIAGSEDERDYQHHRIQIEARQPHEAQTPNRRADAGYDRRPPSGATALLCVQSVCPLRCHGASLFSPHR